MESSKSLGIAGITNKEFRRTKVVMLGVDELSGGAALEENP